MHLMMQFDLKIKAINGIDLILSDYAPNSEYSLKKKFVSWTLQKFKKKFYIIISKVRIAAI